MSQALQTPPRALPGTYFQTPAARHAPDGPSFQSSISRITRSPFAAPSPPSHSLASVPASQPTASQQQQVVPSAPNAPRDLKPTERAAQTLNDTLVQDSRFPELDQYLSPGHSSEYDIPTSLSAWTPFHKPKVCNLPDQVFEQYNRAQVSTAMGLFAELNHAWFAIDNALYMWDYTSPSSQLLGFESQPNNITAVSLAVPRPGVFLPSITNVIVLATTKEILLLGLGSELGAGGVKVFTLYQTGISVSLKNLSVTNIASSNKTGRIFFGGDGDNDVYELVYQQEEKWFSSRCMKVNHTAAGLSNLGLPELPFFSQKQTEFVKQLIVDDSRNLLYTLSSASTIRVFHMTSEGRLNLAITRSASEVYNNIGHIITPNEALNPRVPIISISAVPATEANKYHLVATTATGYRIYLSVLSSTGWVSPNAAPSNMLAQHVKTPPVEATTGLEQSQSGSTQVVAYQGSNPANGPVRSLTATRTARRYQPGYFFCFVEKDGQQNTDTLFVSTPDSGRLARPAEQGQSVRIPEIAAWFHLGSRAEDIGTSVPYSPPHSTPGASANESAVQFDKPAPEIAILTNTGVHLIQRRRLVDVFATLSSRKNEGDEGREGEVKTFIRRYGRTETLSTALAVACGQGSDMLGSAPTPSSEALNYARTVFIEYGGKPTINENRMVDQSISAIESVKPSPRHDAVALYIARLLRSTWKNPIAREGRGPTGGYAILPATPLEKLQDVQRQLSALQTFFATNRSFIEGLNGPEALTRATTKQEEVALQGEHRAVHALVKLVGDTIEGISFVLVLFEERVEEIIPLLPEEVRPQILQLTFEELFSSRKGYDIAKDLVKAIVNRNIAKGSNVETVAEALRRRCGNFCSAEDVVMFKAQELLKRASEAGSSTEYGRNLLNESLTLFQEVAESLPMEYLRSAIAQYLGMQFFAGAILLALKVAKDSDKADEALSWLNDGKPESDGRQTRFQARTRCYDLIHEIIDAMEKITEGATYGDGLLATRRREAYDVVSRSTDEVFLTNLYDWYLAQGWDQRLLETDSFFIVTYLERKAADNVSHADLLCRYYSRASRYYDAANVQLMLAKSNFDLPLERRIEYLSRAKANASTNTTGTGRQSRQRLLTEIVDCLDVANIQDDIYHRLKEDERLKESGNENRLAVLQDVGGRLLVMDELFNKYADAAGYYDLCLLVFQVADHRNASDIKNTWQLLLQKTHDDTKRSGESQPYEAIAERVRDLGARLRLSESTFPIPLLVPMLERYSIEFQRDVAPPHWIIDLFLDLQVAPERLFSVLEAMIYNEEAPFHGNKRKVLGNDLVYLIQRWFAETARAGGHIFDSEETAIQVDQLLQFLLQLGLDDQRAQTCRIMRDRIAQILH